LETVERTLTAEIPEYTVASSDLAILADATHGPISITLPAASSEGKMVFVQKVDSSRNAVLLKCAEGDGIDFASSLRTTNYLEGWMLIADGVKNWTVISKSNSSFQELRW
jgi:hypothetical protein